MRHDQLLARCATMGYSWLEALFGIENGDDDAFAAGLRQYV
jgi:hypothetical protein